MKSLKEQAGDDFRRALNDMFGLVPEDQREQAITYLRQLQQFGAMLTDAIGALDQVANSRNHFLYSAQRQLSEIERIELGEEG